MKNLKLDSELEYDESREYETVDDGNEFEFCPVLLCNRCGKTDAITLIVPANDGKGTEYNFCKNCEPQIPYENSITQKDKRDKQRNTKKNAEGQRQQQLL